MASSLQGLVKQKQYNENKRVQYAENGPSETNMNIIRNNLGLYEYSVKKNNTSITSSISNCMVLYAAHENHDTLQLNSLTTCLYWWKH